MDGYRNVDSLFDGAVSFADLNRMNGTPDLVNFMPEKPELLRVLNEEIVACRKCPRLVSYARKWRVKTARVPRVYVLGKAVRDSETLARSFLILGLAPAAHGANRTGRMFHGDRSAIFCTRRCTKRALRTRLLRCTQMTDCVWKNAYISATCRLCTPETNHSRRNLELPRLLESGELEILKPKAILALGRIAWDAYLEILKLRGVIASRTLYTFAHGAEAEVARALLDCSASTTPANKYADGSRNTGDVCAGLAPDSAFPRKVIGGPALIIFRSLRE